MVSEKEIEAAIKAFQMAHTAKVDIPLEQSMRDALSAAARVREEDNAEGVPGCMDCGLPYIDDRFQDLFVPNHVWQKIAPDDGLLCPNCLCGRAAKLGIECQATFHSGPFRTQPAPQPSGTVKDTVERVLRDHIGPEYEGPIGEGGCPRIDWYGLRNELVRALSALTAGKPEPETVNSVLLDAVRKIASTAPTAGGGE